VEYKEVESLEGAIWVATGAEHLKAASESANSFKRLNKDRKTLLFTDIASDILEFDYVFPIDPESARPKIDMLGASPFEKSIYFDTDTLILSDLSSVYEILDNFEMAGCQVQLWQRPRHNMSYRLKVPDLFPEINCGVLAYRKSKNTNTFFKKWSQEFVSSGFAVDQTTFREALWESRIRFHVLPEQMNKRLIDPCELIYTDKPSPLVVHLPVLRPPKNAFHRIRAKISKWYFLKRLSKRI